MIATCHFIWVRMVLLTDHGGGQWSLSFLTTKRLWRGGHKPRLRMLTLEVTGRAVLALGSVKCIPSLLSTVYCVYYCSYTCVVFKVIVVWLLYECFNRFICRFSYVRISNLVLYYCVCSNLLTQGIIVQCTCWKSYYHHLIIIRFLYCILGGIFCI